MRAIAVTPQATTVVLAKSNSKDDSNIITAQNSRNASNSRNENRKQQQDSQHCMDDSKSRNAVKIKGDSSNRDNSVIMDTSRDTSNNSSKS
jgi:hypothetical protein